MSIAMIVVFVAVFYFFLIRPESKRKKEAQTMRDSIKVGDTVVTIGGITGEIEEIRTETITIFTGDCSVDVQKWAIREVKGDLADLEEPSDEEGNEPEE